MSTPPLPIPSEQEEAHIQALNVDVLFFAGYAACELRDRETGQTVALAVGKTEAEARTNAVNIAVLQSKIEREAASEEWRVRLWLEHNRIDLRFFSEKVPEGLRLDSPDLPLDLYAVGSEIRNMIQGRLPTLRHVWQLADHLKAALAALESNDRDHAERIVRSALVHLFRTSQPFVRHP